MRSSVNFLVLRKRILEQRDLRRCESEHHEQYPNQADGSKSKPRVLTLHTVIFEYPPLKEEDEQCGDTEDGDSQRDRLVQERKLADYVFIQLGSKNPLLNRLGKRVFRDCSLERRLCQAHSILFLSRNKQRRRNIINTLNIKCSCQKGLNVVY